MSGLAAYAQVGRYGYVLTVTLQQVVHPVQREEQLLRMVASSWSAGPASAHISLLRVR